MKTRPRFEAFLRFSGTAVLFLCAVGAIASLYVVLVRVPALAQTKLDALFGTLQGVAVGLLFAIAALLITLTFMVRRASLQLIRPGATGELEGPGQGSSAV